MSHSGRQPIAAFSSYMPSPRQLALLLLLALTLSPLPCRAEVAPPEASPRAEPASSHTETTGNADGEVSGSISGSLTASNAVALPLPLSDRAVFASVAAAPLVFQVSLDTSSLIGNGAAPFFLNFQLNDGEGVGDGNNTVTASDFHFGAGGSATGSAQTSGGASGNLFSGITLTDTSAFNDFTQGLNAGASLIFNVTLSTSNIGASGIPDLFTFAIYHSADPLFGSTNIPTTDVTYQLFTIALNPNNPVVSIYRVDVNNPETPPGIAAIQPVVTAIPEPGSIALLAVAVLAFAAARRPDRCLIF